MYDVPELTNTLQAVLANQNTSTIQQLQCLHSHRDVIKYSWEVIENVEIQNVDIHSLCLRIAILSLSLAFHFTNSANVTELLRQLINISLPFMTLSSVGLHLKIRNLEYFQYLMCESILNALPLMHADKEDVTTVLWKQVYKKSCQPSKYRYQYFQLLIQILRKCSEHLQDSDLDGCLDLACNNIDLEQGCCLLRMLFHRYRYKYFILSELLNAAPLLRPDINHDDFSDALVYAQTRQPLLSAASQLNESILCEMPHSYMIYHAKYELILQDSINSHVHQKNIIDNYIATYFKKYPENLMETIEKYVNNFPECIGVILQLLLIGVKSERIKSDAFNAHIDHGLYHKEEYIRLIAFEVLCSQVKACKRLYVHSRLKSFLTKNITSLSEVSHNDISKSFTVFIKNLQLTLINLRGSEKGTKAMMLGFVQWLLHFLIIKFSECTNNEGVVLSKILLEITLQHFTLQGIDSKDKNATLIAQLIKNTAQLKYLPEQCFIHSVDIIMRCNEYATVRRLFNPQAIEDVPGNIVSAIQKLGTYNIQHSNFINAEITKGLLELLSKYIRVLDTDYYKEKLKVVIGMTFQNWCMLESAQDVFEVMEDNPLHPFTNLGVTCVRCLDTKQIDILMNFIEETVHKLIKLFLSAVMNKSRYSVCVNVSYTFQELPTNQRECNPKCSWLVIKECIKLSATITKVTNSEDIVKRCIYLLIDVIKRCFHSGALELTMSLLGEIVSYITKTNKYMAILDDCVSDILDDLPNPWDTTNTSWVSAGTPSIIESIAMNDTRKHKHIYHRIIRKLLNIVVSINTEADYSTAKHAFVLKCIVPLVNNKPELFLYIDILVVCCLKSFTISDPKIRTTTLQIWEPLADILFNPDNITEPQRITSSLEETFSRYTNLREHVSNHVQNVDFISMAPILSIISQSYSSGVYFVNKTVKMDMYSMKRKLKEYLDLKNDYVVSELIAKAYVALCPLPHIFIDTSVLVNNIKHVSDDNLEAHMLLLKTLLETLFMYPMENHPNSEDFSKVKMEIVNYLNSLDHNTFSLRTCTSCFLIYHSEFIPWRFNIRSFQLLLLQACAFNDIAETLPYSWLYLKECYKHTLTFLNTIEFIRLIKWSLYIPMPDHFRCVVIETLDKALSHRRFVFHDLSIGLICTVFKFMHTVDAMRNPTLMTMCEDIFLKLNPMHVSSDLLEKVINLINDTIVPDKFIPAYCSLAVRTSPNLQISKFYIMCANKCIDSLQNKPENVSILKCVKYVAEFATQNTITILRLHVVELIFKMLNSKYQVYQNIGCDALVICMNNAPTHAYLSTSNLINPNFISLYLGREVGVKFLISMLSVPTFRTQFCLRPIDTSILEVITPRDLDNLLWCSIQKLLHQMTDPEKKSLAIWFQTSSVFLQNSYKLSLKRCLSKFY